MLPAQTEVLAGSIIILASLLTLSNQIGDKLGITVLRILYSVFCIVYWV